MVMEIHLKCLNIKGKYDLQKEKKKHVYCSASQEWQWRHILFTKL